MLKKYLYGIGLMCALLSMAPMSGCPTPVCDGNCDNPLDVDDCAMCCSSKEDCHLCCENSFEGSPQWNTCSSLCDRRWMTASNIYPNGLFEDTDEESTYMVQP